MTRGRKPVKGRCPADHPLGEPEYHTGIYAPGSCELCGLGPIHGARASCPCSFERLGRRVCRECAIAYDFATHGASSIGHDFSEELVKEIWELIERGRRLLCQNLNV